MSATSANQTRVGLLGGRSPLLRLQSDERLIVLLRGGNDAAFELLFSRYRARLLAFCRHMLNSKEDAEDILQEVFAAAYNAIKADSREINVRPWLYRIARNRCLNHLRRPVHDGQDSMDEHVHGDGISTADLVHKRADLRDLLEDVQKLPETQRTALLLREIDVLSYGQIADAMETTVPSVKSLLVRARMALAEAAEARKLTCDDVRHELAEIAEGLKKATAPLKRHVRECDQCRRYRTQLRKTNTAMAMAFPVGPILTLKKLLLAKFGATAAAGSGGGSAGAATATGSVAAGGIAASGAGSALPIGLSAAATKAVTSIAVAALLAGGAVEATRVAHHRHRRNASEAAPPSAATPSTRVSGGASAEDAQKADEAGATDAQTPDQSSTPSQMTSGETTSQDQLTTTTPDETTTLSTPSSGQDIAPSKGGEGQGTGGAAPPSDIAPAHGGGSPGY